MKWIKSLIAACLLSASPVAATESNQFSFHAVFDYNDNWYSIQIIPAYDRQVNYVYLEGNEGWTNMHVYCFHNEVVQTQINGEGHPPELQQAIAKEWCGSSYSAQTEYWE